MLPVRILLAHSCLLLASSVRSLRVISFPIGLYGFLVYAWVAIIIAPLHIDGAVVTKAPSSENYLKYSFVWGLARTLVVENSGFHFALRKYQHHNKDKVFMLSEPLSQVPLRISWKDPVQKYVLLRNIDKYHVGSRMTSRSSRKVKSDMEM